MREAVEEFGELVCRGNEGLATGLDRALMLIAAAAQPGLDVAVELGRLDDLAADARGTSAGELADWLFGQRRFSGNVASYYDPQNSYLNRVLDRGTGIPISLAVLFIEIGRRKGIRIEPVGMPGHFLTRSDAETYFDPFNRGERLDRDGCEAVFQRLAGAKMRLQRGALEPTSRLDTVHRVLANLHAIARRTEERRLLEVTGRLRAVMPNASAGTLLELAHLLASMSQWGEAADLSDRAIALLPPQGDASAPDQGKDHAAIRAQANQWRSRLN